MKSKNEQLDEIFDASGFPNDLSIERLPEWIRNLRIGYLRYEKVRRLSPVEFGILYRAGLETGGNLDDAVDRLSS